MTARYDEPLQEVAAEAFSTLGFMFPMDEEAGDEPLTDAVVAEVSFSGPQSGALKVAVAPGLPAVLAANMMGADDEAPPEQQLDAFKEMANVICGNILPRIAGEEAVFDVHPPEILQGAAAPNGGRQCVAEAGLLLDGGRVEVSLFLNA
ncbi:MAG: chemotaxis protein CheX [Planctomycetes bacterium]|nr:chemotaxis protein CheX [Planctomycetota bacterium]